MSEGPVRSPWYAEVTAYQWLVLAVASAGWVFDAFEGQIFNVIDDPDLKQREYFRTIRGLDGCPRRVVFIPVGIFAPAVLTVDLVHRLLKRRPWPIWGSRRWISIARCARVFRK